MRPGNIRENLFGFKQSGKPEMRKPKEETPRNKPTDTHSASRLGEGLVEKSELEYS
jgi:hypothetical protein